MTTTADLIDICSLYYTQAFQCYHFTWCEAHAFRCSMYALSARLILEGAY